VLDFVTSKIPTLEKANIEFPVIAKTGINQFGRNIRYYFNYSNEVETIRYPYASGTELIVNKNISEGDTLEIKPWNLLIIES
jgi:beta-galactosidase